MQRIAPPAGGSAGIGVPGKGVSWLGMRPTARFLRHAFFGFEGPAFIEDRAAMYVKSGRQAQAISTREILSAQDDPADSYVRITSSYQSESRRD